MEILWDLDLINLTNKVESTNLLSPDFIFMNSHLQITITNVYGPTNPTLKLFFLESLKALG
jgi:hypothetical protein